MPQAIQPFKQVHPSRRLDIDWGKAIVLRYAKGLSYEDIGDKLGCCAQTIHKRLSRLPAPDAVQEYDKGASQVFRATELALITNIVDPEKLAKASLNNVGYTLRQVHEMGRLERGQSTENKMHLHCFLKDVDDEENAKSRDIESLDDKSSTIDSIDST